MNEYIVRARHRVCDIGIYRDILVISALFIIIINNPRFYAIKYIYIYRLNERAHISATGVLYYYQFFYGSSKTYSEKLYFIKTRIRISRVGKCIDMRIYIYNNA